MSLFFELGTEQSDLSAVELKNGLFQANTTFRELTYIGWSCIDLSNAPSATQVVEASYKSDGPDIESANAKMEADMYRAELEYRQAYGKLKALMGAQ
jgi:hypothetical protein